MNRFEELKESIKKELSLEDNNLNNNDYFNKKESFKDKRFNYLLNKNHELKEELNKVKEENLEISYYSANIYNHLMNHKKLILEIIEDLENGIEPDLDFILRIYNYIEFKEEDHAEGVF